MLFKSPVDLILPPLLLIMVNYILLVDNYYGQLGASYGRDLSRPSLFDRLIDKKIVQVSCGYSHMGVVTSEGEAYVWGNGY